MLETVIDGLVNTPVSDTKRKWTVKTKQCGAMHVNMYIMGNSGVGKHENYKGHESET
jgi:predicted GTPase